MLIVMCGLPGTGKSTLADMVAKPLKAMVIRTDEIRKKAFPKPAYTHAERAAVYALMAKEAAGRLARGNVILDAAFYRARHRNAAKRAAREARVPFLLVEVTATQKEALSNLAARARKKARGGKVLSDAKKKEYFIVKRQFQPVRGKRLVIRTSNWPKGFKKLAAQIVKAARAEEKRQTSGRND